MTLGGFVDGVLVGTAALIVSPRLKQRHKGQVVGVYVAPAWRRTGLARALTDRLIDEARSARLIILMLSVTVGNEAARRLYLNAGFVSYGIEPRSLMIGSELVDTELMALPVSQLAAQPCHNANVHFRFCRSQRYGPSRPRSARIVSSTDARVRRRIPSCTPVSGAVTATIWLA